MAPLTDAPNARLRSAPLREDDDINDVAFMAGVNLREENAQILTTKVGSVVQSCQDQLFLSPNPALRRILRAGTSSYAEAQGALIEEVFMFQFVYARYESIHELLFCCRINKHLYASRVG